MPNTFNNTLAIATAAAQQVAAEPKGFIDAIDFRPDMTGATAETTVSVPIVPPFGAPSNWSPSLAPTLADVAFTGVQLNLNQLKQQVFHLTGEQINALNNGGDSATSMLQRLFAEAMRSLANQADGFIATLAKNGAGQSVGVSGTTPFASNMNESAAVRRALDDMGCPMGGVSLVLDPAAAENARRQLGSVVAAGGSIAADSGRSGLLPVHNGMQLRLSPNIATHTGGTLTGVTVTPAITAGMTSAAIAGTTVTLTPGDVVTAGADTRGYVSSVTLAAGGTLGINRPGFRIAQAAGRTLTVAASYTPNIALHRQSIVAVARPIAQPQNVPGSRSFTVTDTVTGLPFGVYEQVGDGVIYYSVRLLYGAVVVNPHLIASLRG